MLSINKHLIRSYTHPPTHPPTNIHRVLTEDSHNTRNFIPYSSRTVCGFFNVPQGTNEYTAVYSFVKLYTFK